MATKASEWKKKGQTGQAELKLPSGNVALVRRLAPEAFLASGLIPDSLTDMVNKAIKSKKGLPPDAMKKIEEDPKKLMEATLMMDQVLCYVVMEPPVEMPPKCAVIMAGNRLCDEYYDVPQHTDRNNADHHHYSEDVRDEEVLYADEVNLNDKTFIFQYSVGGTADVERFREELGSNLGDVPDGEVVEGKAKRTARRK
jgi:hypothetical protein